MKFCGGCQRDLIPDEFGYKSNPNRCNDCMRKYYRNYYANNRHRDKQRNQNYRSTVAGRTKLIMGQVRARNKKLKLNVTVTEALIHQKLTSGVCEASGLPLNITDVKFHWDNPLGPSLDRIESEKGYTNDNIQLVCNMYNRGKNKHDELDFIAMCVAVAQRHGSRDDVQKRLAEMRAGQLL